VTKSTRLGALGTHSHGKVRDDDEGDLQLAITPDPEKGIVMIMFGRKVTWLGLIPATARRMAEAILAACEKLE
jgi:hypothetical protein